MKTKILEEQIRMAKDWHSMVSLGVLSLETLKILEEGYPRYRPQIRKIHEEIRGGGNISASMDEKVFHPLLVGMIGIGEDILINEGTNTLQEALHKAYSSLELELRARNKKYGNEAVFFGHFASLVDLPYEKRTPPLTTKIERALWVIKKIDFFQEDWRNAIETVRDDFHDYGKEKRDNSPRSLAAVMLKHERIFDGRDITIIGSCGAKEKSLVAALKGLAHCYQIILGKNYSSSTINSLFDKYLHPFIENEKKRI